MFCRTVLIFCVGGFFSATTSVLAQSSPATDIQVARPGSSFSDFLRATQNKTLKQETRPKGPVVLPQMLDVVVPQTGTTTSHVVLPGHLPESSVQWTSTGPVQQSGGAGVVQLEFETKPLTSTQKSPLLVAASSDLATQSKVTTATQPKATQNTTPEVDTVALRYYAAQRDLKRVGAEMRRLQTEHPNWTPPSDLFTEASPVDEKPLWDISATGDYGKVHREIAAIQSVNPTWKPSSELLSKLKIGEARIAVERAFRAGNWAEVTEIPAKQQELLVCAEMQAMWYVGEALVRRGMTVKAFELYKYILENCENRQERVATVQKASQLLPPAGTQALVGYGETLPDGGSEFEHLSYNPLRRTLAGVSGGKEQYLFPISLEQMNQFAQYAERARNLDDISMLAWYYYVVRAYEASAAWFTVGGRINQDPELIEGLILSLHELEEDEEAFKIAELTYDQSADLTQRYLDVGTKLLADPASPYDLTDEQIEVFKEVTTAQKSAQGAQAIGWDSIEKNKLRDAENWFQKSMKWEPNEGAAIGLAVRAARSRHFKTLRTVVNRYGDDYPELKKFIK